MTGMIRILYFTNCNCFLSNSVMISGFCSGNYRMTLVIRINYF